MSDSDFVLVWRSDLREAVVWADWNAKQRLRAALAADQYKDLAVALEARSGVLSIEGAYRCAAVALGVRGD